MKHKITALSLLFLFTFSHHLYSHDSLTVKEFKIGFGATIEKTYGIKFDGFSNPSIGVTKIYIPMIYKYIIKIQPEISFWDYSYEFENNGTEYQVFHYGLSAFYIFKFNETLVYIGPRYSVDEITSLILRLSDESEGSRTDTSMGITLGGEYFFSNHFSLGVEIQFNSLSIGSIDNYDYEQRIKATEALIFVALYIL